MHKDLKRQSASYKTGFPSVQTSRNPNTVLFSVATNFDIGCLILNGVNRRGGGG